MKKIQAALMAVMFCFSVAACGGGPAADMANISKEACACKDKKCFEATGDKWKAMKTALKEKYPKKEDAPKEIGEAYKKHRGEMRDCGKKLKDAEKK